ncbi:MAG: helix-turn-helix domain-containing protein [Sphingopyxis sp.]
MDNQTVGQRLRAARETAKSSLADIATQTKVPIRMLDAIERDAVDELPTGPYATGFARSFARAVGLDENAVVADIRALMAQNSIGLATPRDEYEPADANRVPPANLAWTAAGIFALLVVGYIVWRAMSGAPDAAQSAATTAPATATTAAAPTAAAGTPAAPVAPVANGAPVLIGATGQVWFSLEDATGRSRFSLTLNAGEFYTVKPDQAGLTLRTGRPQALRITVGGRPVPPIGQPDQIVSGVALDAASLSHRAAAPAPTAGAVAPIVTNGGASGAAGR